MLLTKLKPSPQGLITCAAFGGIQHNPKGPFGTWYDARNLSSDMSPTAVARRERGGGNIDGNRPENTIVAMCGGDHIVLLDETGVFWCNGHSQAVSFPRGDLRGLGWAIVVDRSHAMGDVHVTVTPQYGHDRTWSQFGGLGLEEIDGEMQIVCPEIRFRCAEEIPEEQHWECDFGSAGETWEAVSLSDYGITVEGDNWMDGVELILRQYSVVMGILGGGHRLVRMGARVIDAKAHVWIDAVKLAAGEELEEGVDYGCLDAENLIPFNHITLTLCDKDGKDYSGVAVSATEPTREGRWLDISGEEPVLREWSAATAMWVEITSPYVRIKCGTGAIWDGIRVFDTVQLSANVAESTDERVVKLLNSWHYIYGERRENGSREIIVAGILPDSSVVIDAEEDHRILSWSRTVPDMDFVVEAGNRLWGCRYDEEAGINEIYASKLGDPWNWHVFQGLSTDSWTASRGTAAPFTGAAVLNGCPLFFREESMEKVYPSANGAHQIQTFDLEGVEQGAADSLCVIEDRLFYKSRQGVMVYSGTMPRMISGAFGDMRFRGGSGARHKRKYCLSTTLEALTTTDPAEEERVVLVYDLQAGDWHIEADAWYGMAVTWKDRLYFVNGGSVNTMENENVYGLTGWYAETAPQALTGGGRSLTENKWISYLRVRFKFLSNGTRRQSRLRIYISYNEGPWQLKKSYNGNATELKTFEIAFLPRRRDNFRLRFEGEGPCQIYDISYRMEKSQLGH